MTDRKSVRLERADAVVSIVLARTGMHNALVPEFLDEFLDALAGVANDASCRAVLLRAEGPAFSIGGDMRRFQEERSRDLAAYADTLVGKLNRSILALLDLPQPVVAAVDGPVTGGSLGIILASDLVYLSPRAVFKAHYATAGFCPDGGWTALFPMLAGQRNAAAALYLNRSISAAEAVACGFATEVVAAGTTDDAPLKTAMAAAQKIARYPHGTMTATKLLLRNDRERIAAALDAERVMFLKLIGQPEALSGVDDFLSRFTDYPKGD
jgi:2-(1,2-epoxy-1,2-dihydrophenyl)acetyl-CoA isomerase